jgi:DNA-binding NarL/FixJ family response regulator
MSAQARPSVPPLDVNLGSPLRVVVASRHQPTRSRIRAAVERAGFAVVAECGDGATATAAVVRERAHLCLIDSDLPGAGEVTAAIASLPLAPKVVVFGSTTDQEALFAALELGASGYLSADLEPARLAGELRNVAEGGIALAPAVALRIVEQVRPVAAARLTDREWKALELVAAGLTTKEIGQRLRVSSTAVGRHISSAVRRIGSSGRPHETRNEQGR